MANFAKKLEEASDEELYSWVNDLDFRVVPLASDELTRRRIQKLTENINKLNDSTEKYSRVLVVLTIIMIVAAIVQITISAMSVPGSWAVRLSVLVIFLVIILFASRKIIKDFL
jgi:uncharacterized membrane protein